MKWIALALAVVVGLAAAAYLAWIWAFPSATVRYRLTLEVETNGQPVIGSGVIEVTRQDTTSIGAIGGVGHKIKGEAVVVDLGERGLLLALLHGREVRRAEDESFPPYVILEAFATVLDKRATVIEQMRMLRARRPKADLPTRLLPMLVRFRDINNPTSVEKIDPDNLAAAFGPSVKLRRAAIEITEDAVTHGIARRLQWLSALNGKYLDGGFTSRNAPLGLHAGNFQMGTN